MTAVKKPERENLWAYGKRLRFVRAAVADAFPQRAPETLRVLDVGCGNGSQLALPLARRGFQVTGIDTDSRSIEHARQEASNLNNADFICGPVEQLEDARPFDVVILSEVLEHVPEPSSLLAASVRRMTPNGLMIVTVPNGFGEFEIDSWLFRTLRLQRAVEALVRSNREVEGATDNHESGHIQFFTRRRLRQLFEECGLKIVREGAAGLFGGPLAGHTLARSQKFIEWNARVTDKLPLVFSSGWYFALRRLPTQPDDRSATNEANV